MSGWVAGAGVEYAFLQNWSAKAEYLYVDLGSKVFLNPNTNLGGVPHIVTLNNHIVRVGLNYRFSF
jgi:outer membrane immunogenic protein